MAGPVTAPRMGAASAGDVDAVSDHDRPGPHGVREKKGARRR
jgi:hypothetical protein